MYFKSFGGRFFGLSPKRRTLFPLQSGVVRSYSSSPSSPPSPSPPPSPTSSSLLLPLSIPDPFYTWQIQPQNPWESIQLSPIPDRFSPRIPENPFSRPLYLTDSALESLRIPESSPLRNRFSPWLPENPSSSPLYPTYSAPGSLRILPVLPYT